MSGVNPLILPSILADLSVSIEGLQRHGVAKLAASGASSEQIRELSARFADLALYLRAEEMRVRHHVFSGDPPRAKSPPCLRLVS
jgi:hypothetical protein